MSKEKKKKESGKLSRREFLKDAGLVVGGAALGSTVLLAACAGEPETTTITSTAPGTTVTSTAPGTTVTGPGSTTTVTGPGATVTSTAPGATTTVTAPGTTVTSTVTSTVTGAPSGIITVLTPTGYFAPVERQQLAERPTSLDGKKIYLVDISFSGSYDLADEMYNWFQDNRPDLDVTITTELGSYNVAQETPTWEMIRDNNGVAAIIGGH